jgi:hypothetical protein
MAKPEHRTPIPKAAFWLGAGGLIPFVVIASAMWALPDHAPVLRIWLIDYAAVMLSFAGGLHWGLSMLHPEMTEQDRSVFMAWSVVPAVVGWISLLMPLAKTSLILLITTFVIQYAADRQLAQRFQLPSWYLRLRVGLTAVAVLCLALALTHLART